MRNPARVFYFVFILLSINCFGQRHLIDSLQRELSLTGTDTGRIFLLFELSKAYGRSMPDSGMYYASVAERLSDKPSSPRMKAIAGMALGVANLRKKNYVRAESYLNEALVVFKRTGSRFHEAECRTHMGAMFIELGDYRRGEELIQEALRTLLEIESDGTKQRKAETGLMILRCYHIMYLSRSSQSRFKEALEIVKTAEKFQLERNIRWSTTYNSYGALYLNLGNPERAIHYFNLGLRKALENHEIEEEIRFYSNLGYLFAQSADYFKASEYYRKGIARAGAEKQFRTLGILYENLGNIHMKQADYPNALGFYIQAWHLLEKHGKPIELASICSLIGDYYIFRHDTLRAMEFLNKSRSILEPSGTRDGLAVLYGKMGIVYQQEKNYVKAMEMFLKSLRIRESLGSRSGMADSHYQLAGLFLEFNGPGDSSRRHFEQALRFNESSRNLLLSANCYSGLGKISFQTKEYEKSIYYFKKAASITGSLGTLKELYENYKLLSTACEKAGYPESALNYYKLYTDIKDSVLNESVLKQTAELEKKYESEIKEARIRLLNKDNEIAASQIRRQKLMRNSILGAVFLFLILGVVLFSRFRIRQKEKQLAERLRISADLHDDIGATLSSFSVYSEVIRQQAEQKNYGKVKEMVDQIGSDSRTMIESMSDIVWAIDPRNDSMKRVLLRMKHYANTILGGKKINPEYLFDPELENLQLGMEKRRSLFLIFKEGINNMAKYSNARHAVIQLSANKGEINLIIRDDGSGFDENKLQHINGLNNMRYRASQVKGTLHVNAAPGSGTELRLNFLS